MGNQAVVTIKSLKEKIIKALEILIEVAEDMETKTIVQTVSIPEASKKAKKGGRPKGSKNKAATPPTPPGV